jgi:hypothetical protein
MKVNMFFKSIMVMLMLAFINLSNQGAPDAKFSPVGSWEYHVPGVAEGYEKGVMVITENEDGFIVEVGPSKEYLMKAEKVEYNKGKLSFVIYVEYEEIKISGKFDKDKYKGLVSYVEGEFDVTATKVPAS